MTRRLLRINAWSKGMSLNQYRKMRIKRQLRRIWYGIKVIKYRFFGLDNLK